MNTFCPKCQCWTDHNAEQHDVLTGESYAPIKTIEQVKLERDCALARLDECHKLQRKLIEALYDARIIQDGE